ncbi:MAG: hypothetical protein QOG88_658 [Actinomycetota bacterium]|nr:hypothetical protein [Actinomycetota bacterium]
MIVHEDHLLGSTCGLGDQEGRVVHVGDADRLDAGVDGGPGEPVIGDHQVRRDLFKHAPNRLGEVRVARFAPIGEHGDAVPVVDEPVVIEVGFAPMNAVCGPDHPSAIGQPAVERVIEERETHGVPSGEQYRLPSFPRLSQSPARGPACQDDGLRADVDGAEPGVSIDRRAGGRFDQREDIVERKARCDARHAELLVGVPIDEHEGVVPDVVEGVRRRAGNRAVQQGCREFAVRDGPGDPAIIQTGETADVSFDNVHGSGHGTGGWVMQLKGAVAVVTGASSGIGEATAVALAQRGAKVVLAARRSDRLDDLADRIERAGGRALAVRCDVGDHEQLRKLRAVTEEAYGPADILVNNAGVRGSGEFAKQSYEEIQSVVQVNLTGVLFGTRAFLPGMLARGHGHIVNMASIAGRFVAPGAAVYSATKHAVVAFSEALNYETERRHVLVTAVNPGFVATEGFPQGRLPDAIVMKVDRVSDAVIRVVADGIAPEFTVPRWLSPLQTFRVLTPPLYRWGMRRIRAAGIPGTNPPTDR